MNWKTILFGLILVDFVAFSIWAFIGLGWSEGWAAVLATPWNLQTAADLCIAVAIGIGFMWRDARQRGINPVPFAIASACLGSIGLLSYLVRREWSAKRVAPPVGSAARA